MKMLQEKFEVSRATLKRDIEVMRDRLEAPVFFDRAASGYVYIENEGEGGSADRIGPRRGGQVSSRQRRAMT